MAGDALGGKTQMVDREILDVEVRAFLLILKFPLWPSGNFTDPYGEGARLRARLGINCPGANFAPIDFDGSKFTVAQLFHIMDLERAISSFGSVKLPLGDCRN